MICYLNVVLSQADDVPPSNKIGEKYAEGLVCGNFVRNPNFAASEQASTTMKPYLIGISGGSGSGKTSFIRRLRTAFSEEELCILSQDDYYLPRDQQHRDHNDELNFDLPR